MGLTTEGHHLSKNDVFNIYKQEEKFAKTINLYRKYKQSLIQKAFNFEVFYPCDDKLQIENIKDSISIDEARKNIIDGLSCLGPEYVQKLKECFDNNIVHWDATESGDGGYCVSGLTNIDEHPIKFEWDGSSMSTTILAHELGHNISAKLLKQYNKIDNMRSSGLHEIPSIVNTLLMTFYYLKKFKQENVDRNYLYGIYTYAIDYVIECIARPAFLFMNFYYNARDFYNQQQNEYTFERNAAWLNRNIYGFTKKEEKMYCQKYPWFIETLKAYTDFLDYGLDRNWKVLQYYIGMVVALPIAWKIFNGDKVTLNKYLKFLKEPTNMNPLAVVKVLGINLLKPEIYTEAKNILAKLVKDFTNDIQIEE